MNKKDFERIIHVATFGKKVTVLFMQKGEEPDALYMVRLMDFERDKEILSKGENFRILLEYFYVVIDVVEFFVDEKMVFYSIDDS